jgi:hypothetical protein
LEASQTEQPKEFKLSFQYQPKQKALFQYVSRNGGMYLQLKAPQCLEVGGIRSGKTNGKLVYGIENYCLKYKHCDMLVLRRTISELKSGAIEDFFKFFPKDSGWYTYNHTERVATFANGSRLVFGGCVRAGTLIDTRRGLVRIEHVTTDDFVLTRKGYRRVLWSGKTGTKSVVSVGSLYLTAEHPIYCNGEFIPAREIVCRRDSEKTAQLLIQKSSFLMAAHIAATQNQQTIIGGITSPGRREAEHLYPFTPLSGKVFTGQSRQDLKSITTTAIASTMNRTTSSLWSEVNTENSMLSRAAISSNNVRYAERNSSTAVVSESDFAGRDVAPRAFLPSNEIPSSENANFAEQQFLEIDARMLPTATIYAASDGMPVPVYDLTVEDAHEYFANGILVHNCENLLEKDIEKYLGQSYPFILVDECGQFSDYAWNLLYSRNLVNVQCEPDDYGNYPIPAIVGCTNPTGAYWNYYHTVFVKQEPWDRSEGMKRAKDGRWFVERSGEMVCVYDPKNYAFNHSTVLDNAEYIKRQPNIVAKLRAMPEALMKKFLQGYMDTVEGPYFDCFNEEYHVIDLRTDPDAIQWQDWQLVWVGHDWGVGHWSAAYFFTKAMCKVTLPNGGEDWKLKTVCFQEVAPESTGYSNVEFADMLNAKAHYPRLPESHGQFERISGKRCKVSTIYFSHEKFSRVMEKHSPSDEYSQLMRARGLPSVSRATMDRVGSAGFMYNELKLGRLVILKTCPGIIMAIPSLQRNKDNLDDVLKVDTKADDRYDAFRYGLYGGLSAKGKPQSEKDKEYADTLEPMQRHFYMRKAAFAKRDEGKPFKQEERPYWESKVIQ